MNINCPYCDKETTFDICDLGSAGDGDDIEVSCHHCDRMFLATLNVDVYLDNERKCDCLEDDSRTGHISAAKTAGGK